MKYIRFSLIILLVLISIAAHELSHGLVMKHYNIEIKEIGMGVGPTLFQTTWNYFQNTEQKKQGVDVGFTVSLIPIAAFVEPSEKGSQALNSLPFSDQAYINGVGVFGNIIVGLFYLVVYLLLFSRLEPDEKKKYPLLWTLVVLAGLGSVSLVMHDTFFWDVLFPILGTLIFIIGLAKGLGPIWIRMAYLRNPAIPFPGRPKRVSDAIYYGAEVSFIIGMFNILPLYPLDGGHTAALLVAFVMPSATAFFKTAGTFLTFYILVSSWTGAFALGFRKK